MGNDKQLESVICDIQENTIFHPLEHKDSYSQNICTQNNLHIFKRFWTLQQQLSTSITNVKDKNFNGKFTLVFHSKFLIDLLV
uniref:Uncharacterized protein n=1 Tax=Trichogramma kaykai TaxID=54128 RepID=A0ABD2XAX2_9HYME